MPSLGLPTAAVRDSYITGESADAAASGASMDWLEEAGADFGTYAAVRSVVRQLWEVPVTELWYVEGATYFGTLVIRHRLTPQLRFDGGHIGYNVVSTQRRKGHATAMLAASFPYCRALGLTQVLLTCEPENIGSRRVIEANGGRLQRGTDGICRYWISLEG